MSTRFLTETPWEIAPDTSSVFEIYNADDHYLLGNGIDRIQKYAGTSMSDLEGSPPYGNIFAVYKDRFMVAGDPDFPHRIWYSHIRNAEGWSKDYDWIEVRPEDGGKINGLDIQGDELLISKSNGRIYGWQIFDDGRPESSRLRLVEDDKGFVNQKAATVMDDILYYLDRSRFDTIPVTTRGGLSYIVEEIIAAIQSFSTRALGSNDGKVYVALGDIDIELDETISLENAVLVYDYINQGFYLRDTMDVKVFSKFVEADGQERIYFGDSTGKVYKLDETLTAGNSPIHMLIRTKPYFRELGKNIHVKKIGVYMDDPDGTVVNYRTNLNQKFTRNLGTVTKEPVHWFEVDITGPLLQLELTHSNTKSRPRLNGIDIDYEEQGDAK